MALAFANAVLFALYIVLAHRVARHAALGGIDGLARPCWSPPSSSPRWAGWAVAAGARRPGRLLAGIGVGVSSSVIPYVADQLAMGAWPARPTR